MINKQQQKMPQIVFMITLFAAFPIGISAATLHAIIAVDTDDQRIGRNVRIDLGKMQGLVNNISRYTGLATAGGVIYGNKLNRRNIMAAVESLSVAYDDVVLFYYAGHGYNYRGTMWPAMDLPNSNNLALTTVREKLKAKNPRLIIVIADTCNGTGSRGGFEARYGGKAENYKALFLKYRGSITASSAKLGSYSYSNAQVGGFYTNAFMNSLSRELLSNQRPSWNAIMQRANATLNNGKQHPQAKVEVKFIGTEGEEGGFVSSSAPNTTTCQRRYRRGGKKCCLDSQGKEHCWSLILD